MIYSQCICKIIFILLRTDFLSIAEPADGTAGTIFWLFKQISNIVCYQLVSEKESFSKEKKNVGVKLSKYNQEIAINIFLIYLNS